MHRPAVRCEVRRKYLGLNWYVSDNAKFVVDWDNTQFQGGAKTPAEVSVGNREAENIVFCRAQVVY